MSKPLLHLLAVIFCLGSFEVYSKNQDGRRFNSEKIESVRNEIGFEYGTIKTKNSNWLERFGTWLSDLFTSFSDFLSEYLDVYIDPIVFRVIFYGLMIIGVAFLIIKILESSGSITIFRTRREVKKVNFDLLEDDIEHVNFHELIKTAQEAKNYTLVVRYYYLLTLQTLSEKGAIEFHIRKTNCRYIQELGEREVSVPFGEMASLFEYIWYGNYSAEPSHCTSMSDKFNRIKSHLG